MVATPKHRSKTAKPRLRLRLPNRIKAALLVALAAVGGSAQAQDSWIDRWNANSYNNYVEAGYNQQDTDFVSGSTSDKPGYAYIRAAKSIANDKVYLFGGFSRASYEASNITASTVGIKLESEIDVTSRRIQIGAGSTYELKPNMDLIAEVSIISEKVEYSGKQTTTQSAPYPPSTSTITISSDGSDSYTTFGGGIYFRPDSLNNTAWWAKITRESRFSAFALEVGGQLQLTSNFSLVGQINTYDTTEVLVYGAGVRYNF